ncbi:Gfo/Idh/MocA family protein [Aridibaculum aurantiacum]|uniref:Gfo/Idh/MocA family protein n=1 Tax=Aridibaculum aurantiacum TaxID=2810307 RepID=UPI001A976EB7|nr:Gfo/Idh/MocA family oxidoreductase [Aridibaculum aurantiacum]
MKRTTSRRTFLSDTSWIVGGSLLLPGLLTAHQSCAQQESKKLGIALVGLGSYSANQLAPALQETKDCYLAGIVTGTPSKEEEWAKKYNIPQKNIYNYQNFDSIANNKDIDIVYVVLPIAMHKEFTIRAAQAGKHVICEKPMALNAAECQQMIDACKKANRMLSIGYRLHFEPYNQEMMRLGQQKVYGAVKTIDTANGFTYGGDPNAWRLKKALAGGGGLMDMGVYCVQGARYTVGEEPIYVTAREEKTRPELFKEVDETVYFDLEFPGGTIAHGISSYNKSFSYLKAKAERGWFDLTRAFPYRGLEGATIDGPMKFDAHVNQQARQMDDFAQCVKYNKPTRVPGEEGMKDMKVIDAIYRSIASGKREKV